MALKIEMCMVIQRKPHSINQQISWVIKGLYEPIEKYLEDMVMKTDASTIKEIEKLLQAYEREVMLAQDHGYLQPNTTRTYLLHSRNFVKWCKNEFEPGGRNK